MKDKKKSKYKSLIDGLGGCNFFNKKWGLKIETVQNWKTRGIPRKYWKRFIKEFGVTLEELV